MTTYLRRVPNEIGWVEIELQDLRAMQLFVGGNIERISLPMGIDLWVNEDFLAFASYETLCLGILQRNKEVLNVFGNVFLSSSDDEGNMTPLSSEQVHWLRAHTELFFADGGKLVMMCDPHNVAPTAMRGGM